MDKQTAQVKGASAQVTKRTAQRQGTTAQVIKRTGVSINNGHVKMSVCMIVIITLEDVSTMNKRPTPEYRAYVVKLVVEEGRKATQLAFELGIGESTIRRWVKEYREQKAAETQGIQYVTPTEFKRMQNDYDKRLRALEEENAILKKGDAHLCEKPAVIYALFKHI